MKKNIFITLFIAIILLFAGCSSTSDDSSKAEGQQDESQEEVSLTVSAAVSLTDALEEIQELYNKNNNVEFTFDLDSSGSLAKRIQQGAPVDVFISANQKWMDTLEEEGEILTETREDVTGNNLVLITGEDSPLKYESFEDISVEDVEQIALGEPESVPAGGYTKEILTNLQIWDDLESIMVFGKNVRSVLTYVETGDVEIGFVYESDALSSDKIKVLATAPEGTHEPIIYPGAVVADTDVEETAKEFLDFMTTDAAQDILAKHGFNK